MASLNGLLGFSCLLYFKTGLKKYRRAVHALSDKEEAEEVQNVEDVLFRFPLEELGNHQWNKDWRHGKGPKTHEIILVSVADYKRGKCILSSVGKKQTDELKQYLVNSKFGPNLNYVHCGKRLRNFSTAKGCFPDIDVNKSDFLNEAGIFSPDPDIFNPDNVFSSVTNEEWRSVSGMMLAEAAYRNFFVREKHEDFVHKVLREAYVIDQNTLRYFVLRLLQLPLERWGSLRLSHGSVTWLTATEAGINPVQLKMYSDSHFSDKKLITSFPTLYKIPTEF